MDIITTFNTRDHCFKILTRFDDSAIKVLYRVNNNYISNWSNGERFIIAKKNLLTTIKHMSPTFHGNIFEVYKNKIKINDLSDIILLLKSKSWILLLNIYIYKKKIYIYTNKKSYFIKNIKLYKEYGILQIRNINNRIFNNINYINNDNKIISDDSYTNNIINNKILSIIDNHNNNINNIININSNNIKLLLIRMIDNLDIIFIINEKIKTIFINKTNFDNLLIYTNKYY